MRPFRIRRRPVIIKLVFKGREGGVEEGRDERRNRGRKEGREEGRKGSERAAWVLTYVRGVRVGIGGVIGGTGKVVQVAYVLPTSHLFSLRLSSYPLPVPCR